MVHPHSKTTPPQRTKIEEEQKKRNQTYKISGVNFSGVFYQVGPAGHTRRKLRFRSESTKRSFSLLLSGGSFKPENQQKTVNQLGKEIRVKILYIVMSILTNEECPC